jgi:hypothetical protein
MCGVEELMVLTNDYRRPKGDTPDASWVNALQREVSRDVRVDINELRTEMAAMQATLLRRMTDVHVAAPTVNVEAPKVTVDAPVEVDLGELAKRFAGLEAAVKAQTAMLAKPITRTVVRDSEGRIVSMTEKRG